MNITVIMTHALVKTFPVLMITHYIIDLMINIIFINIVGDQSTMCVYHLISLTSTVIMIMLIYMFFSTTSS